MGPLRGRTKGKMPLFQVCQCLRLLKIIANSDHFMLALAHLCIKKRERREHWPSVVLPPDPDAVPVVQEVRPGVSTYRRVGIRHTTHAPSRPKPSRMDCNHGLPMNCQAERPTMLIMSVVEIHLTRSGRE